MPTSLPSATFRAAVKPISISGDDWIFQVFVLALAALLITSLLLHPQVTTTYEAASAIISP